jgi:hypothetical protein
VGIYDALAQVDPYDSYRVLRERFPVYRNRDRDFWALSRFADVQRAAREWRAFSSAKGVNLDDTLSLSGPGNFISADPPDHDRLRKAVRGRFTPRTVAALEREIRADVRSAVSALAREGDFDAAARLAWSIPVRTISRLLGAPVEDETLLIRRLRTVIRRDVAHDEVPDDARTAAAELREYFLDLVGRRRASGRDDLLSDIVDGEREGRLEQNEVPGLCILLYIAGSETVADFIGNALLLLAEHPDARAALVERRVETAAAVEELLRFESPVQYQVRTATAPAEWHGTTIPAGARVVLLWGAANRDERRWEHAGNLDLARPTQRNVAFGEGIHHCLGAPLARLQGRIVIEEVLREMPGYRLAGETVRIATHNTRGLTKLPISAR